jgi:hypothetical protein
MWAADIRSKVTGPSRTTFRGLEIDPDVSIYGVPFDGSEDEFMKVHGSPDGYVRLSDAHTALLYGRSHAFVFERGKLVGVRIAGRILDWNLVNELQDVSPFDDRNWRLKGGIFTGMKRSEVRAILGDKLLSGEFGRHYYTTAKARVDLEFYHRQEAKVKAGDISVDWSYGYTNKGFILLDRSMFKATVHGRDEFEKGP